MLGKNFLLQYAPGQVPINSITATVADPDPSSTFDHRMTTNDHRITSNDHRMTTNDHRMTTNNNRMTTNDNRITTNDHRLTMNAHPLPTLDIDLETLVRQIESAQIDITSTYDAWLRILFALSDHLGESGRDYAHRISQFYPGYKPSDCDKQFSYCLRAGKYGITIRTLYYIAQQHGIIASPGTLGSRITDFDWHNEFSINLPQVPLAQFTPSQNDKIDLFPSPAGEGARLPDEVGESISVEVLPFPVHIFPPPVADLVSAAAKSIGCPPDFIAIPVLAVLATAIGNSRHIQVKKGWTEPPTLYSAIVAPPGSKKSPALSTATQPIREIQQAYGLEYKNAQDEFLSKQSAYNIQVELWKKRKPEDKDPSDQPVPPVEPFMKQIKTNNATIEAIANLLEQNPHGILFEQDELAAWAKSMNAYRSGKGSDIEIWLSFWGCIQTLINRAYRKVPQSIDKPHVTVSGCIQPDLLSELSGIKQNGFFDRILFSYPDSVPLHYSTDEISDSLASAYGDVVKTLFQLRPDIVENQIQVPSLMHFTIPARHEWENWNHLHDSEMNNPNLPYYLLGAWSKLQAYMARFILIMQLTSNAVRGIDSREIYPESVLAAAQLLKYFKSHTRKVYDTMYNSEMDVKIGIALNWINRHDGSASEKMMLNNKVGGCKSVAQVRELLQEMVDRQLGQLTSTKHSHGGRPKIVFTLNNSAIAQNPSQANDSQ